MFLLLAFFTSFFMCYFLIKYSHKKKVFIDCHESDKPQRFHSEPTPRIGGVGIFVASLASIFFSFGLAVFFAAAVAFVSGILEDLTGRLSQRRRLIIQSIGALIFVLVGGYYLKTIGMGFEFPYMVAVIFTVFAIVGVTNAINIIDGLNGLAGGVSLFAFLSFATLSYMLKDTEALFVCLSLAAAILGFLVFNFPKGKIFLGDGGAYFLGFMLAIIAVMLVARQGKVSAWFFLAVLIYPIWEVVFSIIRRRMADGKKAMGADKMHLHHVLMRSLKISNPKAALVTVLSFLPFQVLPLLFYNKGIVLLGLALLFIALYQLAYFYLTKIFIFSKKHNNKE
jgi:UDP-N-acetylmuramyl pentapeptide phosphotransferase/UDP-N-acetylglucosamine-1-phosphate transferase